MPVSDRAWQAAIGSGARALAAAGARLTVAELLQGMAVLGANDAAVALAEGVAGSVDDFVARMNRQAQVFGLKATQFRNPDGRAVSGQASTPRELAWIAVRLLTDFPQALTHYRQPALTLGGVRHASTNLLLLRDPSVDGLQVAYADRLGYAMAATSRRPVGGSERRLVALVVGTPSAQARATETQKLLNWGYSGFDVVRLFAAGQAVSTAPVWKGSARSVPLGRTQAILVAVPGAGRPHPDHPDTPGPFAGTAGPRADRGHLAHHPGHPALADAAVAGAGGRAQRRLAGPHLGRHPPGHPMKDMAMNQPVNPIIPPEQSLIEYPCPFPIKVMGPHLEDFVESVVALIVQHDPSFDIQALERRPSSTGKYCGPDRHGQRHQP